MTKLKHRDTFKHFTERALEAVDAGTLINPIVYLPKRLRAHGIRLTEDNLRLVVDPPTIEENNVRVAAADPLGFLIAMMNGQPIPSFEIEKQGAIIIHYEVPDLDTRERIATFLSRRMLQRYIPTDRAATAAWDATIRARADSLDTHNKIDDPTILTEGEHE